jgi:hypothetical protein
MTRFEALQSPSVLPADLAALRSHVFEVREEMRGGERRREEKRGGESSGAKSSVWKVSQLIFPSLRLSYFCVPSSTSVLLPSSFFLLPPSS